MRRPTVLCIPDLHLPWVDWRAVSKLYAVTDDLNPDYIIQLGDCFDLFAYSKFAKRPVGMTPEEELEEGRQGAARLWENLHKAAPKARKIQLAGNHENRLMQRAAELYPASFAMLSKAQGDFWKFKGVKTIHDHRHELEISGVTYCHGWMTNLGAHARYLLRPVVHGHSHRGGTIFMNLAGRSIWELDCGYLADKDQAPLQYGATKTVLWTLGYGVVDALGPRFVPL